MSPRRSPGGDGAKALCRLLLAFCLQAAVLAADFPACEDLDGDGFLRPARCGAVADCNDDDPNSHPGAPEVCDGADNDCNGLIDDAPDCDTTCDNPEVVQPFRLASPGISVIGPAATQVVWAGDSWIVLFLTQPEGHCSSLYGVRLDRTGNVLGSPVRLAGFPETGVNSGSLSAVWTGRQLGVSWNEQALDLGDCQSYTGETWVKFRRFHRDLSAAGSERRYPQAGCPESASKFDHGYPFVSWNGQVFGCLRTSWSDETREVKLDLVDRSDRNGLACGSLVSHLPSSGAGLDSDGDLFGVLFRTDAIYFRRMAEDGTALDGTPLLVTDVASYKTGPSVTWASGEWAPVWADARDSQIGYTEVYMCRLTSGGEKIDPPGDIRVTCCNDAYHGIYRVPARPAWTGAEYGLVYSEALSGTIDGDLFFQRIDASGDDVGPPLPVTTGGRRSSSDPAIAWNGREFGVAWRDKQAADPAAPYRIYFTRIGCNCTDADADHYSTCAGNDCDDSDPLVNPGALEDCVNGTDDNCDAAIDCQDQTACPPGPGTTPGEVAGVAFEGQTILSWAAQPSADVYDVLHGTTSELRADGDFGRASCLAWRVAATSLEVPEIPPAGDGTYYLVRAKTDPCLLGTWGDPLRDEARLTCP